MTAATTQDLDLDAWSQHPLVTTAVRRLGDEYSAADLLFELHDIMTGLEDRFPTVPFRTILACHNPGAPHERLKIRKAMSAAGVADDQITLLIGDEDPFGEQEFQLALADVPAKELCQRHGRTKTIAAQIRGLRTPYTDGERKVLEVIGDEPTVNKAEVSRRTGLTIDLIRKTIRKRRYQAWLETQGVEL